ncbi:MULTISPECIES: DinB family protein [unclassified Rhodanobacter]|uniref:DinB family protein n=1 Tax=unclassified Rhodanobacter TaxID=2621553 RepID=UPI001BE10D57|nr:MULTISPECIES: DinB family protein [unclassified Rhodanobacter]MBT2145703.1 DinB family protein [Rhodanobacter sp. LX-99]MBT2149800.1 DinB family protein [Rhodanobacter sp. LX-100]
MSLKPDFELMARYNQWMNARLYAAAAQLDETELHADRGAFFGSIAATLDHILVADTHWLKRFAEAMPGLASLDYVRALPLPEPVRGITFPDFARLRSEREAMDAAIVDFTCEASDDLYARPLSYVNSAGESHTKLSGLVLRHVFNHQTHHRGQVTTLFSQLGIDVGVTDLSALIPERLD